MKVQADSNHTDREFQAGEKVILMLQPYTQHSLVSCPCHKLAYKFSSPYTVIERIGAVAYRLDLAAGSQIYPVFCVSQLKQFLPDFTLVFSELPKLVDLAGADAELSPFCNGV